MAVVPVASRTRLGRARERAPSLFGTGFALLLLVAAAILVVGPFVWMASTSLRLPRESFTLPPKWLPTDLAVGNYAAVFSAVPFFGFFLNSVFISGLVVAGQVVVASMAAYAFARLRFPGRDALFGLLMASLMIPIQATVIPIFILLTWLGLANTLWSLILPGWVSAFGVFLLRQYFLTVPNDLEDAARIDGASVWQIYWRIMLPLARPSLAVLGILTFNGTWNEYFRPLIFLGKYDVFTLPVGLVTLRGNLGDGSVSVVLAGVVLSLVPVLLLYVFAQRYLVEGITSSAVKG